MSGSELVVLQLAEVVSAVLLGAAFVLTFIRLLRGPSIADRVLALDLMGILCVGTMGLLAIVTRGAVFLDVAIVVSLIGFLGTVAFAHYIGKRGPA